MVSSSSSTTIPKRNVNSSVESIDSDVICTNSKKRKFNTYLVMNDNNFQQSTVHCEDTEKSKERFKSSSDDSESEKESLLETKDFYARKCVEFLDTLDFDDVDVREETLDYIDASM